MAGKDADEFMNQVADELQQPDLTHEASFQEFCGNAFGLLTAPQAAESWERDFSPPQP